MIAAYDQGFWLMPRPTAAKPEDPRASTTSRSSSARWRASGGRLHHPLVMLDPSARRTGEPEAPSIMLAP